MDAYSEELKIYARNPEIVVGFMSLYQMGTRPLYLPGESYVWHRVQMHGYNIRGKYNPGLHNEILSNLMENKWFEGLFWMRYAPTDFPKTEKLSALGFTSLDNMIERLNRLYPSGWILKGIWDWATEKNGMVTSELDFKTALNSSTLADFEIHRSEVEQKAKWQNPEEIVWNLKQHPGYLGWKIKSMFENPETVMVQPLLKIKKEYRVEAINGRVLGNGSTVDRYEYLSKDKNPIEVDEITAVERYVNSVLEKLPAQLRITPYSFDIALLENGEYKIIETNPGGNSGFIASSEKSIIAMNQHLKKDMSPRNIEGLTAQNQIRLAESLLNKAGGSFSGDFANFRFKGLNLYDDRYKTTLNFPNSCSKFYKSLK